MNNAIQFLKDCGTFYIATIEGDQPRVRPFGAVSEFEGKYYICTNKTKNVAKQLKAHPKFEISATSKNMEWIRLTGEVVLDERREAKAAMLEQNPGLNNRYTLDDGVFEVYYLKNATATILSYAGRNETIQF